MKSKQPLATKNEPNMYSSLDEKERALAAEKPNTEKPKLMSTRGGYAR